MSQTMKTVPKSLEKAKHKLNARKMNLEETTKKLSETEEKLNATKSKLEAVEEKLKIGNLILRGLGGGRPGVGCWGLILQYAAVDAVKVGMEKPVRRSEGKVVNSVACFSVFRLKVV